MALKGLIFGSLFRFDCIIATLNFDYASNLWYCFLTGEVHHLQSEMTRYEAQRESLAQELVSVSSQVDALQTQLQDFQALQQQYKDMEQKYNALLQVSVVQHMHSNCSIVQDIFEDFFSKNVY